jgi:hypothetical protein
VPPLGPAPRRPSSCPCGRRSPKRPGEGVHVTPCTDLSRQFNTSEDVRLWRRALRKRTVRSIAASCPSARLGPRPRGATQDPLHQQAGHVRVRGDQSKPPRGFQPWQPSYTQWVRDVEDTWLIQSAGLSPEATDQPRIGSVSTKDWVLIADALNTECDVFLTMDGPLVAQASVIERKTGLKVA